MLVLFGEFLDVLILDLRQDLVGSAAPAVEGDDLDVTAPSKSASESESESKSKVVSSDDPKTVEAETVDVDAFTLPEGHSMGLLTKLIFLFAVACAIVFSVNLRKANKTAHKSLA